MREMNGIIFPFTHEFAADASDDARNPSLTRVSVKIGVPCHRLEIVYGKQLHSKIMVRFSTTQWKMFFDS